MSTKETTRDAKRGPRASNERDFEQERRALRQLIDHFRAEPESNDDGGFYRNVGRFIIRPLMRPPWPGDKRH